MLQSLTEAPRTPGPVPAPAPRLVHAFRWQDDDTLVGWVINIDAPPNLAMIEILINGSLFRAERCSGLIDRADVTGIDPALSEDWARVTASHKVLAGAVIYRVPDYVPRTKPAKITVRNMQTKAVLFEDMRDLGKDARHHLTAVAEAHPFIRFKAELEGGAVLAVAQFAGAEPVELVATRAGRVTATRQTTAQPGPNFLPFLERRDFSLVAGRVEVPADDAEGTRDHGATGL